MELIGSSFDVLISSTQCRKANIMIKIIQDIRKALGSQVSCSRGVATLGLFLICLVCYWKMSPYYGVFIVPYQMKIVVDYPPSFLQVIWTSFLGGFWHGDLSHVMRNWAMMIVPLLVIEKKLGPLQLILFYCLCNIFGGLAQFHMTGGLGIGSSCVTFGVLPLALFLMTRGITRALVLPVLIVMSTETAKWWIPDGIGHVGHLGGMMVGIIWMMAISVRSLKSKSEAEAL